MTLAISFSPQARLDAIEIASFIASNNPDAGRRFLQAINETANKLRDMPRRGVKRCYDNPALSGMRMVAVKGFRRYLLFYQPDDMSLLVVRIVEGSRDLERMFSDETGAG